MSTIYYKFKSSNEGFQSIGFDGVGLALSELKREIVTRNKLALGPDHTISILDSQSGEGAHMAA